MYHSCWNISTEFPFQIQKGRRLRWCTNSFTWGALSCNLKLISKSPSAKDERYLILLIMTQRRRVVVSFTSHRPGVCTRNVATLKPIMVTVPEATHNILTAFYTHSAPHPPFSKRAASRYSRSSHCASSSLWWAVQVCVDWRHVVWRHVDSSDTFIIHPSRYTSVHLS